MSIENFNLVPAFLLGALHALEPGHGKMAIIGYLIGQRGSWLPALALGIANALTHGGAILLVAYLINIGFSSIDIKDTEEGLHYFSVVAGVSIILLSFWFLRKELKEEECCEEAKVSMSELARTKTVWEQVRFSFLIGVTGGMIPCSSAIAMYFANISDGNFQRGVYSVIIFSFGLAVSVFLSTWLIVRSTGWVSMVKKPGFAKKILWVRFTLMMGTGVFLIFH